MVSKSYWLLVVVLKWLKGATAQWLNGKTEYYLNLNINLPKFFRLCTIMPLRPCHCALVPNICFMLNISL